MLSIPSIQAAPDTVYPVASISTMYFVGVTTAHSSSMRVFPQWAKQLGLGDVALVSVDCALHDAPQTYRRIVEHIKSDPLTLGALVTTHKLDLLAASRDMFDELSPHAAMMNEVSSIYKRGQQLLGHATDSVAGGRALDAILPPDHWATTGAEAFVLGAGGSSTAITCHLIEQSIGPERIVISNRSAGRLDAIRSVHEQIGCPIPIEYHHTPTAEDNDALLNEMKPGSLVINATGLGKDAPGSPITSAAQFPPGAIAWDFNYRGDLMFLDQARAQQKQRELKIEDGWIYFIHGWLGVIADVFNIAPPTTGKELEALSAIAAEYR